MNMYITYKESKMNKVESPCVGNCCLSEKDICMGCLRSLEEIKEWGQATDKRKKEIIIRIESQKSALK
jgi:predicted Fe-S protein YdhL (DUF1289 family)